MQKEARYWTLIAISICAAFLTACAAKPNPAQSAPPPPDVEVTAVKQENVPVYGDWVATLEGFVNANIQPQVTGYLLKQDYREGSFVHKGQVLFEIDPRPFQAVLDQALGQLASAKGQLAQAQAQLGLAQINVKRDTPLAQAHAIAQSQLDNDIQTQKQNEALIETNQAGIKGAAAAVEQAQLNLGFTKVRSLIDGIAGITTTQIGNLVTPSTVLTAISQVNPIKAYFSISEQEYLALAGKIPAGGGGDLLRSNAAVPLELTLANNKVYGQKGRVLFADRQVNTQTGSIQIVGAFANPGNILRPGQFGRIRAVTATHENALLVPQRAVSELQGRYQVAVVGRDNKVGIRSVQTGPRVGELWVINSGLQPGDRVVSEGTSKVREGAVVNPKPDNSITVSPYKNQGEAQ
ncbi:MAG: efflux RND transporter periplasmic adaptor subunit [Acidobacteriaceae bacterium]|nr:efflux RND transporter periplasmic adaptor subunit [Acidobacteriaceae bacterium]